MGKSRRKTSKKRELVSDDEDTMLAEHRQKKKKCNRDVMETRSTQQPLPQQNSRKGVSVGVDKSINMNENSNRILSILNPKDLEVSQLITSKGAAKKFELNQPTYNSKVARRSLNEELNVIDAQFDKQRKSQLQMGFELG